MKRVIRIDHIMAACKTVFNRVSSYINSQIILQTRKSLPFYEQKANFKAKELSKFGLPEPPKKPLSSFFKFRESLYSRLKEENPNKSPKELMKLISEQWAIHPLDEKEKIKKQVAADTEIYKKRYKEYKESLSPEDNEKIKEVKLKLAQEKESVALKKKTENLNRPLRPLSPYALYFRDMCDTVNCKTRQEAMKALGENWRNETVEVRKKYKLEGDKVRFAYKAALKEWEQKMIKLGHLDVIGTKALKKLHKEYQEKEMSKRTEDS